MSRPIRRGFKSYELLVVIAIIAILIGLCLPATRQVRKASDRVRCSNNLKQMMLSIHEYADSTSFFSTNLELYPTGCLGTGDVPEERLSWMVALLPYLELEAYYRQFDLALGYEANQKPAAAICRTYLCEYPSNPSSPAAAMTHYVALAGLGSDAAKQPADSSGNGFMGYDRFTTRKQIKDGLSYTIALFETRSNVGPYARGGTSSLRGFDPNDLPILGDHRPFGGHRLGANVAMVDGSCRFIREDIDPRILAAATTIAGGESETFD